VFERAEINKSEDELLCLSTTMNQMVAKSLVNGGMVSQGRKKATEILERVVRFIEYSKDLMQKNRIMINQVTNDRNNANQFIMGFENLKDDLEIKIRVYAEDLGRFNAMARSAISSFDVDFLKF